MYPLGEKRLEFLRPPIVAWMSLFVPILCRAKVKKSVGSLIPNVLRSTGLFWDGIAHHLFRPGVWGSINNLIYISRHARPIKQSHPTWLLKKLRYFLHDVPNLSHSFLLSTAMFWKMVLWLKIFIKKSNFTALCFCGTGICRNVKDIQKLFFGLSQTGGRQKNW